MKKALIIIFFIICSYHLFAQITLTIEGTEVNNTVTRNWTGVYIPRSEPTGFTYRYNSVISVNTEGYMLQAGDEAPGPSNNNLDGELILGNKFTWKGVDGATVITHGLFCGYNKNVTVKFNYLNRVPYGILFKSGTDSGVNMTYTSGGCAYNICKNGKFAVRIKGINGVKVFNNTFYNGNGSGWYFILITSNDENLVPAPSTGTKIFNNIFYSTIQIPMIQIDSGCFTDFECDYNVYWCTTGEPIFNIDGEINTWAQWRAHGFDAHSVIIDPEFFDFIDFVPVNRLDYGKNLGTEWQTGLSKYTTWIVGSAPKTSNQDGTWQVGARILSINDEKQSFKIYPNPANEFINIRLDNPNLVPDHIKIVNLSGKLVYEGILDPDVRDFNIPVHFIHGIYAVQILSGNMELFTQKLIIM